MTRARTGSHSRTEPGAVHAYEVVDHGVDNAQYFQGCGVAHTQWDDVAVGVGGTPLDAYEDAVEALAGAGWEVDALPERPRGLRRTGDLDLDRDAEMQHFVCVYVRGIPTRRTRMAQQRRAGTVGPGRPGQRFTHGDVEIETTLHPIDLDGVDEYGLEETQGDDIREAQRLPRHPDDGEPRVYMKTRGGKYALIIVQSASDRPYGTYSMRSFTNGRPDGAATGYTLEQMRERMDGAVRGAREVDGIGYNLVFDTIGLFGDGSVNGLGAVSPRTRRGTRVRFAPNPASRMLYSERYGLPEVGEEGTVTYMPGFKPKTYMQGPGGGLLYVEWDQAGVLGVSPNDVERV